MIGQGRRLSIRTLMLVVMAVSGNCAILRAAPYALIPILPMLNLLVFGLFRLRRGHEAGPFWAGFEAAGWTTVGLVSLWRWYDMSFVDSTVFLRPIIWLYQNHWISADGPTDTMFAYGVYMTLYSTPQLLAATGAGWLSARYRVVIERRLRAKPDRLAVLSDRSDGPQSGQRLGSKIKETADE